jgi:hypothetical protein
VMKIKTAHRATEHTCGIGGIRIWSLVGSKFRSTAAWGEGPFQGHERSCASLRHVVRADHFVFLMVLTFAYVANWGNHPEEPLHKFVND